MHLFYIVTAVCYNAQPWLYMLYLAFVVCTPNRTYNLPRIHLKLRAYELTTATMSLTPSLVPRPHPAFCQLQYKKVLKATESWAEPGNEATRTHFKLTLTPEPLALRWMQGKNATA